MPLIIMAAGCALFAVAYVVSGASQREDRKVAAEIERIFRCRQRDLSTEGGES